MFKFAKQRIVKWPVTVRVPKDGGTVEDIEIVVHFKLLEVDAIEKILEKRIDKGLEETLKKHIVGWEGIEDAESGQALKFSEKNLLALCNVPYVLSAFTLGLVAASQGSPAKN